jgi:hypothetical protein
MKNEEKEYKNIEEAKTAYFSYPKFGKVRIFEFWTLKIGALISWFNFAKSSESIEDIAKMGEDLFFTLMDESPIFKEIIEEWDRLSMKRINSSKTFQEFCDILEDKSLYHKKTEILKKMFKLASNKNELDKFEEKNDYIPMDKLIPIRRVEIATTASEIDDTFLKLSKTDRTWALEKWMNLVKTVSEAKRIDHIAIYYVSSSPIAKEVTEKCEVIFMTAANTATTIEDLREISKSNYKSSGKVANKKWDRLSLKEVEAATTDEEVKIAKERSRDYSQAWHIACKRLKANEKSLSWAEFKKLQDEKYN